MSTVPLKPYIKTIGEGPEGFSSDNPVILEGFSNRDSENITLSYYWYVDSLKMDKLGLFKDGLITE